jgi:aspartate racemase
MFDLGIVGGMGPSASASFLGTIYRYSKPNEGKGALKCVLWSDPTFPDRTESIISGNSYDFYSCFHDSLVTLDRLHARRIIVCCFTAHHFIDSLPKHISDKIISLVTATLKIVDSLSGKFLVVATSGVCQSRLFQRHELWSTVEDRLAFPDEQDQKSIHEMLYKIKHQQVQWEDIEQLKILQIRYGCTHLLATCTEMHLMACFIDEYKHTDLPLVDPLTIMAKHIREYLNLDELNSDQPIMEFEDTTKGILLRDGLC